MREFAKFVDWKKAGIALAGASILAVGVIAAPTGASADCVSCDMWQAELTASAQGAPTGANLAMPAAMMTAKPVGCTDVLTSPATFAGNIVSYCKKQR
jgi:hypothetical protein